MAIESPEYELLPDDDLEVSPDEELASVFEDEEDDEALVELPDAPMGRGWAWDPTTNRFVMHGSAPAETRGLETLKQWIMVTLQVARFAHPIYDDNVGMDDPWEFLGQADSPEAHSAYQRKVIDALMEHDRILEVGDFTFEAEQETGDLFVEFQVRTTDDDALVISVPDVRD